MEQDLLMIDIPKFTVNYGPEKYSYNKSIKGKKNLKRILYQSCSDYCMYCYNRIKIDNNEYGHLEHSIEKAISSSELKECIPNVGIACSVCNDKYKKIGERYRRPNKETIQKFKSSVSCKGNCHIPCKAYIDLKKAYLKNKKAQFIMQPLGVTSEDLGIDSKHDLLLQYDIIETKYIPSTKIEYIKKEKDFLYNHIDMFQLNSDERKMKQLYKFLCDTIERGGRYSKIDYNNLVVQLFVEQVLKDKTQKEVLNICETLFMYSSLKFSEKEN